MSSEVVLMNCAQREFERTLKSTGEFNAIVLLHSGLDAMFHAAADVFVAGNHLIYLVEGSPEARQAPDV